VFLRRWQAVCSKQRMATASCSLLHLASVIDMKREKLDAALTEARRQQLSQQLDILIESFRQEFFESGLLRATPPPPQVAAFGR